MTILYVQPGKVLDYTAGADISSGDMVSMGNMVGVALADIANGDVGSVQVEGVFDLPKVSAAVIALHDTVDFDSSAGAVEDNASTLASGDVGNFGIALEAAGNGVTTVRVRLTPGVGTYTA